MLETDALKEKLEMEIHRFSRLPEELSSDDPYFEQFQTILAIRDELENIPLCDIQRDMLLSMENVLESAWLFRNTPVPDRCMNPNNISEVVYYYLMDEGIRYRRQLLYDRAKAEFDTRMDELLNLPPKEILDHAYEKVYKEEFLLLLESETSDWDVDLLLTYAQPLAVLYTEWLENDYNQTDNLRQTILDTVKRREQEVRSIPFMKSREIPEEFSDFYALHGEEIENTDLEWDEGEER